MLFQTCFVARLTDGRPRAVELVARHNASSSKGQQLPSAETLGMFCFPLGPENVTAKERMAPEVRQRLCRHSGVRA